MLRVQDKAEGRGEMEKKEKGLVGGSVWRCDCRHFVKPEREMPGHIYVEESHRQGDMGT